MSAKLFEVPDPAMPHAVAKISEKAFAYRCDAELDKHAGYTSKLAEVAGFSIVQSGGRIRVEGFADPKNGVKTITATGSPSIYIKPSAAPYPHGTAHFVSEASDWAANPSEVAPLLFPSPKARIALYEKHFRAAVVKPKRYTAARGGGLFTVDRNTEKAIAELLPPEHGLEVELLLISAYDPQQADDIAGHEGAPFTTVPITPEGEPLVLGWHGQTPTADEVAAFDRVVEAQRAAARKKLDRELRDFEQRRAQELGC